MKYLLCKIGPYLTILGFICAWMIGNDPRTNAWMDPLIIISLIMIIPGWIFGYKVWNMHIPPIGFAFMSRMDVFDAQWYSVLSWGVRFMSFPFIIATILILIFI